MNRSLLIMCCLLPLMLMGQSWQEQVDQLVEAEVANNQFSGIVLLADQGEPVYQRAVGMASVDEARPFTLDTPIPLASITKAVTAILIMQLVEQEAIALDGSIADYLPDLKLKRASKITVADLLLHRSGLPNGLNDHYRDSHSPQDMIQLAVADGRYGKKGRFRYCNIDYILLGLIIEQATGQAWEQVLANQILTPLNMAQTGVFSATTDHLAIGQLHEEDGSIHNAPDYAINNFYAAGAMYGTAHDLLRLDQSLYSAQLLQPVSIDKMYESHPELGYTAFGSWVYPYPYAADHPLVIERRGGLLGINHAFIRLPDAHKTLIILSNSDRFDPDTYGQPESFKDQLLALLLNSPNGTAP